MSLTEEEHMNQYQLLELASNDLLRGIAILGRVDFPKSCFLIHV